MIVCSVAKLFTPQTQTKRSLYSHAIMYLTGVKKGKFVWLNEYLKVLQPFLHDRAKLGIISQSTGMWILSTDIQNYFSITKAALDSLCCLS